MSYDQLIRDLKDKACCQEEQIHLLREKLVTYDKIISTKEELQNQLQDVKRWIEDIELKEKQINTDLLNNLECQTIKLKQSEIEVCQLQTERNRLLDLNDRLAEQIKALKDSEQKLINSIEELTICKKRLQFELSTVHNKIKEQKCSIEKLTQAIKCKEKEICEFQKQLEERMKVFCRLTENCKSQEQELESMMKELMELKNEACQIEKILLCEREALSSKLEIKCQRLREIEIEYENVRQNLCEEKKNVCKLESQLEEMRQVSEKERCEANVKIQKLQKENCMKEENVSQMKCNIVELKRVNEFKCTEINELRRKVEANECLLEKIKHSSEVFDQMKTNKVDKLEREKSAIECDLKKKKKTIGDMKREACQLKNPIKGREQIISCPSEGEVCCVRDKIKKIESMSSCHLTCPVNKCESSCTLENKSRSNVCGSSTLIREPRYGRRSRENICNVPNSYSFKRPSKFSRDKKTCDNDDGNDNKVISELKQLYCNLEQLKGTTKSHMEKC